MTEVVKRKRICSECGKEIGQGETFVKNKLGYIFCNECSHNLTNMKKLADGRCIVGNKIIKLKYPNDIMRYNTNFERFCVGALHDEPLKKGVEPLKEKKEIPYTGNIETLLSSLKKEEEEEERKRKKFEPIDWDDYWFLLDYSPTEHAYKYGNEPTLLELIF